MAMVKTVHVICDGCGEALTCDHTVSYTRASEKAENQGWHVTSASDGRRVTCPDCRKPQIPEQEVRQ